MMSSKVPGKTIPLEQLGAVVDMGAGTLTEPEQIRSWTLTDASGLVVGLSLDVKSGTFRLSEMNPPGEPVMVGRQH